MMTRKVLKVMGIFSGAEAFGILCSVVKMKLVAMWLSATGVGLFGIFNTTIETISILTGMGLRQSGVRSIAQHSSKPQLLKRIAGVLRSWCYISGGLGALVVSFLSPWLSLWFFGDWGYWWYFMIVSGSLLLNSLIGGEQAILQGTERFKKIVRANLGGSVLGLAVSIPMFWFLGEVSVPLSILAYSISIFLMLIINRNREIPYQLCNREELGEGRAFVKLGGYMALAAFATNLAQMIFMSWLNREASTAEVGYFQAGNTLVFRYTALIFGAVGLEFYPRMSANSHSSHRMSLFVSHEIALLLKIFTPMLVLFLIFRKWIVEILYTSDFAVILPFISIAIFTVILRSVSMCMAFSILAKGDGKTYLLTESLDAAIGLVLNIVLYRAYGLIGIGIAQVIWYAMYTLMIGGIYFGKYRLTLSRGAWLTMLAAELLSTLAVAAFSC